MIIDPDAEAGPDQAWWRAEMDGAKKEIRRLRAENDYLRSATEDMRRHVKFHADYDGCYRCSDQLSVWVP